jgi:hypothetical protein
VEGSRQAASDADHDGLLPCYGVITDGKQHEVTITRQ